MSPPARRDGLSPAERWARLPSADRERFIATLSPSSAATLLHEWRFWARPAQLAPSGMDWVIWLILAGRGWGKSRTAGEWVRERVELGEAGSIGLIGASLDDVRDTMLGEGRSEGGLLNLFPPGLKPIWEPSKRRVTFFNGAVAKVFTAEEPELRGPNLDLIWCDELAKWRYLLEIWGNIEMTLRVPGQRPPRICITTTPRPLKLLKELIADRSVRVTKGSTYDNRANLAISFIERIEKRHGGTRFGRQELFAELLSDEAGALFHLAQIETSRRTSRPAHLRRIVVAVDPAATNSATSDETGIVVVGIDDEGELWVLADLSGKFSPEGWSDAVMHAYVKYEADAVVAEVNAGGDMVPGTIRGACQRLKLPLPRIVIVRASKGKAIRAEPVSGLYEGGLVHHVGRLALLEDELTEWIPKVGALSPNRLDALVWAIWDLAKLGEKLAQPPARGTLQLAGFY